MQEATLSLRIDFALARVFQRPVANLGQAIKKLFVGTRLAFFFLDFSIRAHPHSRVPIRKNQNKPHEWATLETRLVVNAHPSLNNRDRNVHRTRKRLPCNASTLKVYRPDGRRTRPRASSMKWPYLVKSHT
jgi:hypothetical protein